MYTTELNWPHSLLGPNVLNKEQIFDKVVCRYLWPRYSYDNFNAGILDQQRIIEGFKIKLNSLYSQLARLKSPASTKALYEAEKRKLEKDTKSNKHLQKIIEKNRDTVQEIRKSVNDAHFAQYLSSFLVADMDEVPTMTLSEQEWCNIEKIRLQTAIDEFKDTVKSFQQSLNKTISNYHKMRRIVLGK